MRSFNARSHGKSTGCCEKTSVAFSKTAGTGNVSGLGSATAVNGVASLSVTGTTAGSITITASAAGVPNNGTTIFNVVAAPNPHGDVNGDGTVNVADIFYMINFLFAGGPAPIGSGDVNGDGFTNVADIFYLINFLFAGGPAPV